MLFVILFLVEFGILCYGCITCRPKFEMWAIVAVALSVLTYVYLDSHAPVIRHESEAISTLSYSGGKVIVNGHKMDYVYFVVDGGTMYTESRGYKGITLTQVTRTAYINCGGGSADDNK